MLDIQVRDCRYRKCGRVDGIVLELHPSGPPTMVAIEIGGAVLAKRLGKPFERLFTWLAPRIGLRSEPIRIATSHIASIDLQLTLDFDATEGSALLEAEMAIARVTRRKAAR
jgi:hypothetical protein